MLPQIKRRQTLHPQLSLSWHMIWRMFKPCKQWLQIRVPQLFLPEIPRCVLLHVVRAPGIHSWYLLILSSCLDHTNQRRYTLTRSFTVVGYSTGLHTSRIRCTTLTSWLLRGNLCVVMGRSTGTHFSPLRDPSRRVCCKLLPQVCQVQVSFCLPHWPSVSHRDGHNVVHLIFKPSPLCMHSLTVVTSSTGQRLHSLTRDVTVTCVLLGNPRHAIDIAMLGPTAMLYVKGILCQLRQPPS